MARSRPFTITIQPGSLLATIAAGLAPGQSSSAINGNGLGEGGDNDPEDVRQTVQWGNRFIYDHARGIAILHGKDASAGGGTGERSTNIYTAANDTWAISNRFHIDGTVETGHVYESIAYNHAAGRLYVGRWGQTYLQRWNVGSPLNSGWSNTATFGQHWSQNASPLNRPLCHHPDLFGAGDGGLVILRNVTQGSQEEVLTYRESTNTFQSVPGTQHNVTGDPNPGACEYVRSGDYAICTAATGNTYRIPAGSGGALGTAVQIANPPIPCRHQGGTSPVGILIDDPLGVGGPYIFEKSGTNRVWRLIAGAWSLRSYTHPLPAGTPTPNAQWFTASCYPLGVFLAYRQTGTPITLTWRPND